MSSAEGVKTEEERAAEERRGPRTSNAGRGPMGMSLPGEKSQNFVPSAKRLLGRLRPDAHVMAGVVVLSIVSVVLQALGPRVLGRATNVIFAGFVGSRLPAGITKEQAVAAARARGDAKGADMLASMDLVPGRGIDFSHLAHILELVICLYLVAAFLQWVSAYLLAGVIRNAVFGLRSEIEEKLHALPLSYFDGQPRGEILSRVTNDVDNIQTSLQQTISQMLTSLLTVIAMIVMMFSISWQLGLIALVVIPLSVLITSVIGKRSQKKFVQQWRATGQLNAIVEETFTGHGLVKVFGHQREAEQDFANKNDELFGAAFGAQFISGIIMPVMMFVGNLQYVVIAVLGGLKVASGTLSLGDAQAFIQYSRQFTQPLTQVASMANLLQSGVASAERVFDVLDAEEQRPDPRPARTVQQNRGRVEFTGVDFSYDPDKPLIHDMNLVVEPGRTVAIVGPTGAGKTTLVNLVMRFYELDAGRISIDGVDVTELTRADLRSRIGMVLQDTWLFGGTIRDNIAYGRPDATADEIHAAAEATYVDRFVHSLPDGYDTVLDAEAGNISAGEKQLVTIARAFLADPEILILDEATSSVDTRTELLVQQAMNALRKNRTSFVIAHRLSTIRDADVIVAMENGTIVEQGSHSELLALEGGAYRRLYEAQFAGAAHDLDAHETQGADGAGPGGPGGAPAMAGPRT